MRENTTDAACNQTSVLYSPSTFYQREVFVHFICSVNCHVQLQKQRRWFFMQADHWAQNIYTKETPELLNHSLNVENAIVSSPNHVLFIWLGFAPFLFLLIVSRDRQEIRAFRLISNELIIPRGACPDLTEWGHAVESADEPVGQKTKEKHRGKKNTVLSKGKWCFKAILLHTVVKYANQPGRRWEHKQYWVSPDALSQLEERGIKHKGH